MKILVIGFQRSGTTLLRRLIQIHPEVKRISHEKFYLIKYGTNKEAIRRHFKKIDIDKDVWGEKVPFYGNIRNNISAVKYCNMWNELFYPESRIIHIVRHPIDVGFSCVRKYKNIKTIEAPILKYQKCMLRTVPKIVRIHGLVSIKYEDLITDPGVLLPKIYHHCGLDPEFDFHKGMQRMPNKRYQQFSPERAFAYKKEKFKLKYDISDVINLINQRVSGVRYE